MLCSVRKAEIDDAPALARIAREVLPEGWSEYSIRASLARPGACALVTEPIRGFVLGWRSAEQGEILTLAVEKDFRGQGLGRALAVALLDRLRGEGARSVSLEVRSSNAVALGLYGSIGFATLGLRRHYYRDGEDALVLGAAL
jgi:ribosomal-protein-alanine N-acetyltransferase